MSEKVSAYLTHLPDLALVACLVRFLVVGSWPEIVAVVACLVALEHRRRVEGGGLAVDVADLKTKLARVANKVG